MVFEDAVSPSVSAMTLMLGTGRVLFSAGFSWCVVCPLVFLVLYRGGMRRWSSSRSLERRLVDILTVAVV